MKDIRVIESIIEEEEYATGYYTMVWLDKYDEVHEESFDTVEEMYDNYNEEWTDGGWDFDFYGPNGHRITMKKI